MVETMTRGGGSLRWEMIRQMRSWTHLCNPLEKIIQWHFYSWELLQIVNEMNRESRFCCFFGSTKVIGWLPSKSHYYIPTLSH